MKQVARNLTNAFHTDPSPGPPPGEAYSTVGYGLFEPFELQLVR